MSLSSDRGRQQPSNSLDRTTGFAIVGAVSDSPLIVFGYIRVSGKSQVDGDGPERQADAIKRFCKQHGLYHTCNWEELAVSGTVDGLDRPALSRLLQAAQDQAEAGLPVHGIVVERLDRLARDLMVSEALLGELRRRNLKLFAADQGALIDLATNDGDPMRKAIRQIMGVMAELDKSMLVKKLSDARRRVKEQTGWCGGPRPFGHTPGEKGVLNYILERRKLGESYRDIADALNKEHKVGMISEGGWTRARVQGILRHHKPQAAHNPPTLQTTDFKA